MGSTGGRQLIYQLYGADSQGLQDFGSTPYSRLLPNYAWTTPPNFNQALSDPITQAKCLPLARRDEFRGNPPPGDRYSGTHKPVYVEADVLPVNLTQGGEQTDACPKLRNIIRDRGVRDEDDCGHILACQYGGKMVDYNLFPQEKNINRGRGIWSRIWKWGADLLVRVWLVSQADCDPMVRVRIWLLYANPTTSDRPDGLLFHHEYYRREEKKKEKNPDEEEGNRVAVKAMIGAAIFGEVPNHCENVDAVAVKESMINFQKYLKELKARVRVKDVEDMYAMIIEELERCIHPPAPPPMAMNKPFSFWDLVPIVGTIRTVDDAIRCGQAGDVRGAVFNSGIAVISGVLDVLTVRTVVSVVKGVTVLVEEGVKVGTSSVTKGVTRKITEKEAIQIALKVLEHLEKQVIKTPVTKEAGLALKQMGRLALACA